LKDVLTDDRKAVGNFRSVPRFSMKRLLSFFLLASSTCCSQSTFTIPLQKANSVLALPSMTGRDGVLYAAYRSFDLLRFSNKLEVVSYDLHTHKALRHVTISVPKVRGARASEGLFVSEDGQTLAYAELHDPGLILLLATKNLGEIRRSNMLPFTPQDRHRMFAGFDHDELCVASSSYGSNNPNLDGLHFVRLGTHDLKPISHARAIGVSPEASQPIIWLPSARRTWVNPPTSLASDIWTEYTESGEKTGNVLTRRNSVSNGAVALGDGKLVAFYGNMIAKGAVVSYADHQQEQLELPCAAHQYGRSNDPMYVGGICTTEKDVRPEAQGEKILSSQFILFEADGPKIVWQHEMDFVGVSNGNGPDTGFQKGDPLIYHAGSKLLIVAPTKKPELVVYEVPLPEHEQTTSKPTIH
jgi:hypothetical protein